MSSTKGSVRRPAKGSAPVLRRLDMHKNMVSTESVEFAKQRDRRRAQRKAAKQSKRKNR